jgi:hypothetical protein
VLRVYELRFHGSGFRENYVSVGLKGERFVGLGLRV